MPGIGSIIVILIAIVAIGGCCYMLMRRRRKTPNQIAEDTEIPAYNNTGNPMYGQQGGYYPDKTSYYATGPGAGYGPYSGQYYGQQGPQQQGPGMMGMVGAGLAGAGAGMFAGHLMSDGFGNNNTNAYEGDTMAETGTGFDDGADDFLAES